MPKRIREAKAGEKVLANNGPDNQEVEQAIKKACKDNYGVWYCVTHKETFRNNMMKDSHIARGSHVMAWNCLHHGLEQPSHDDTGDDGPESLKNLLRF